MANPKSELIRIENLNKFYNLGGENFHALKDVSFQIDSGEFVSIMGPSGSGKSTLINVLGFLDNDFEGEYFFNGNSVRNLKDQKISQLRNQYVGFIFQSFNLIENMTVEENVTLPLLYAGYSRNSSKDKVETILERLEIRTKANNRAFELSGGQKQRVAIARALVNEPEFIIADEPTGALDTKTSQVIMDILADLHQTLKTTIIMVTHDPSLQRYANKHLVIVDGQIHETGAIEAKNLAQHFLQLQEAENEN